MNILGRMIAKWHLFILFYFIQNGSLTLWGFIKNNRLLRGLFYIYPLELFARLLYLFYIYLMKEISMEHFIYSTSGTIFKSMGPQVLCLFNWGENPLQNFLMKSLAWLTLDSPKLKVIGYILSIYVLVVYTIESIYIYKDRSYYTSTWQGN